MLRVRILIEGELKNLLGIRGSFPQGRSLCLVQNRYTKHEGRATRKKTKPEVSGMDPVRLLGRLGREQHYAAR